MLVLDKGIIYLQIYEYFKREIIKGRYKANQKLPSKRGLSKDYNIAIHTVENAYSKLLEEGFIYAKERNGYFVSDVGDLCVLEHKVSEIKSEKDELKYDFSYTGVAKEGFPYKVFRKITSTIIDDYDLELLKQVDYQGYLPLRIQISQYLQKSRGFLANPNQIIISSGSEDLLQIIFKLLDGVYAIEDPGYKMLQNIMNANSINYVKIPVDESGMDIKALEKTSASVCIVTPAHQFPTGIIMNMKRRIELLNRKENKYIIEDDYDSEFKYSNRPVPALKSIDYQDKVIYIGSFSKSISPSFRVSYMVLPQSLIEKYHKLFSFFICPVSIIVQKTLTKFIELGEFEKHLNRMRKIYSRKRQMIEDILKDRKDIKLSGADAGLHIVLEYPKTYDEKEIVKKAYEKGIRVYGLSSYGKKREYPSILIGFATLDYEEIEEGMKLLKSI